MISAIGLAGALALLIFLTVRGVHILIAAPDAPITSPKMAPSRNMKNQSAKKPVKPAI